MMGVVQANIQTVEDIYRLVRAAVMSKLPLRAVCITAKIGGFVRTDWAGITKARFVWLCYQYAGESDSGLQATLQTGAVLRWRNSAK